jgi:hypothetical protein
LNPTNTGSDHGIKGNRKRLTRRQNLDLPQFRVSWVGQEDHPQCQMTMTAFRSHVWTDLPVMLLIGWVVPFGTKGPLAIPVIGLWIAFPKYRNIPQLGSPVVDFCVCLPEYLLYAHEHDPQEKLAPIPLLNEQEAKYSQIEKYCTTRFADG